MRSRTALRIASDTYEDAVIRGLCHEGALEAALGAADRVDRQELLHELENSVRRSATHPNIRIKRVYEPTTAQDGVRVLVDRLWPRGVSRQTARVKAWFKDLAPSAALRTWFGHDPARWDEFRRRYHRELGAQPQRIAELLDLAAGGTLTLVYAAKDEQHNNAEALMNYLSATKGRHA